MRPYHLLSRAPMLMVCSLCALNGFGPQQADITTLQLLSSNPRPLRDLARQLEKHFVGLRVPYEEAPLEAEESLIDKASPAVKASRPDAIFLVPRSKPVSVTLTIDARADKREQARTAVESVFRAFQASGNQGFFRLYINGDFAFILPTAFKEKGGTIQPFEPLLSTRITVPEGNRTIEDSVRLILADVSRRRGYAIIEGTIPTNFFRQTLSFSADNESARDAMLRLWGDAGIPYVSVGIPPRRVSWLSFTAQTRSGSTLTLMLWRTESTNDNLHSTKRQCPKGFGLRGR